MLVNLPKENSSLAHFLCHMELFPPLLALLVTVLECRDAKHFIRVVDLQWYNNSLPTVCTGTDCTVNATKSAVKESYLKGNFQRRCVL